MDKGLQGRQGPHCGVYEAKPGTEIRSFLSDSIGFNGEIDGGLIEDHCS